MLNGAVSEDTGKQDAETSREKQKRLITICSAFLGIGCLGIVLAEYWSVLQPIKTPLALVCIAATIGLLHFASRSDQGEQDRIGAGTSGDKASGTSGPHGTINSSAAYSSLHGDAAESGSPADSPSGSVVTLNYTDKATGLGNKMRFVEKFKTVASRYAEAGEGLAAPFAVGVVNLDGMKPINDLFGFSGGDRLIEQCAMRLRAAVEEFGFVFRYDGDEFAFIIPDAKSTENVARLGKMLQDVLIAPFDIDGSSVRLSGSFGFAIYPDAGDNYDQIIGAIETALYNSKHKGRGRLTIYTPELESTVRENAILEQALRSAIADEAISPHYQPIISLQDGTLLGFEALARWIDPELGFISPAKFIPLAEERGIIAPLTEVLLLQAARTAADWPDDIFLSFNLSSAQLVDPTTAETILDTIRRAGLPPKRLEIEVTETAMMSDPETAAAIIEELHEAGVRISMDDFGTGQSSLGRLRELKLDKVKIDRAFIMAIGEDKPAEHIVRAILEMCAGLNLTVVAEGIEEINQAESLKTFGCHAGQGYLFGKPQNANKTMGYIREFRRVAKSDREAKIA